MMRNLILAGVVLLIAGFLVVSWKIKSDVADGVDQVVRMMAPYATIEYDGVSATLTGELTVDDVDIVVHGFTDRVFIEHIGIDTPSFLSLMEIAEIADSGVPNPGALPDDFGLIVQGLRMPVNADYGRKLHRAYIDQLGVDDAGSPASECTGKYGHSPAALSAMGYAEWDLTLSAHFRQRDDDFAIEMVFDSADMWSMVGELILVGDSMASIAMVGRERARMSEMRVEFIDESLNDRVWEYCRTQGLADEEIHAAMLDAFEFMGRDNGIVFDEYVLDPYVEFMEGKSTFIMTAKPIEPVNLSQISLYAPTDVPALLQLSAEAH